MTIKSLFFTLFLYVCLVWVGAVYLHSGPQIQAFGLFWTAIGLIALLSLMILARLFGWWRARRARAAARPAPVKPAAPVVSEDEAAVAALIAEANAALEKSPKYVAKKGRSPLAEFPLYLLIGPEGSGKTTTFLNSGLEPQLLAGQTSGAGPSVSTRLCNIWLAKNAIFVEVAGRVFSGDPVRWARLLRVLRGNAAAAGWRSLWRGAEHGPVLQGVIGFCDVKEFTNAPADQQRFERYSADWQERLRGIAEAFGTEFPVYQVVAKCDAIPFFQEFFRRLPASEANQILGCTLPLYPEAAPAGQVFAEAESKRLLASFRPLYHALTARRLSHLAHEPERTRRPGVYEFPRELKRIRAPLVQFLTDAFRPHPLQPGPLLRGYYFTGTRQVEAAAADPATTRPSWSAGNLEATRLFRAEATQMFRPDEFTRTSQATGYKGTAPQWIFVADLFHQVILAGRPALKTAPVDRRFERGRQFVFAGTCAACVLLSGLFVTSWAGNRRLLGDVQAAAIATTVQRGGTATLSDLQALDALRAQVERLRSGPGFSFHWGLYTGNEMLDAARRTYFRRFEALLLNDVNGQMVESLTTLPPDPAVNAPYNPAYRFLKAHLMISSGTCSPEPAFLSGVLKTQERLAAPAAGAAWQSLADRQIDFFAGELAYGNPAPLPVNAAARDGARQYLQKVKGVEGTYQRLLANAEKELAAPRRLADLAPNYTQVLNGPAAVDAAFTPEGWAFIEKASKDSGSAATDSCVVGSSPVSSGEAGAIQQLFLRDYVEHWRKFVAGFSVARYTSVNDAIRKLDILADHKSPILALLALTADATSFPPTAQMPPLEKVPWVGKLFQKGQKTAARLQKPAHSQQTPADISRSFQPVHWIVPPGSKTWLGEKNNGYMDALAQLRHSLQDIARGDESNPALYEAANQNYEKALDAVRQITRGFNPVGVAGLDATVERLLEEPILRAKVFIPGDLEKVTTGKINGELQGLCSSLRATLRKYPFQSSSREDVSLAELASVFAPGSGSIWKFQAQALGEFTVKEGSHWKAKDTGKKPQVTPDMLAFLNRAQQITDVFYPAGATAPQLTYTLRPKPDAAFQNSILEVEIDGQVHEWKTGLQKQFIWPAPPGTKDPGARARIVTGPLTFPFASRGGLWGIFRVMGDAEPRPLSSRIVEWKYVRGGDGRPEAIQPAPVRLEVVEFPHGVDVFNPRFFGGLQCPANAVQ